LKREEVDPSLDKEGGKISFLRGGKKKKGGGSRGKGEGKFTNGKEDDP